jgi:serine/threonine protein kinase
MKEQIIKLNKQRHVFRERDLLKSMDHPNIIKLFGTTADDEKLYFIFEPCKNGDLADLMGSYMRLDLRIVKLYTAQMVHTLEYLQQNEIMHRDLKPQNLMLDHRWNMKFIDFGDAKKEGDDDFDEP